MSNKYAGIGRWRVGLMAIIVALGLVFSVAVSAFASSVYISDPAGVLNTSRVQSEASTLGYPMSIYTTNNFNGTTSDFDQRARSHITQANMLVIAIDTVHKHVMIDGGSQVPLSSSQYSDAINAFRSNYNGGDYTGATIAAIGSLSTSLRAAPAGSGSNGGNVPAPATGGSGAWLGVLLLIGLLVIVGLAVFAFIRRRRGLFNQPYDQPYNQPYNQYNQPPYNEPYNQYNQGYPPNYGGPRQGVNPWVAGGLGAAAGGLLGYELGRQQGEEERNRDDMGNNGGNFDNSGFGGGASGDFGGGGSDFGGGAGGDFGGGGGGDSGGGSSGNF